MRERRGEKEGERGRKRMGERSCALAFGWRWDSWDSSGKLWFGWRQIDLEVASQQIDGIDDLR
jgi:hypothetical protein